MRATHNGNPMRLAAANRNGRTWWRCTTGFRQLSASFLLIEGWLDRTRYRFLIRGMIRQRISRIGNVQL
jgi:hypothetical protein